jgi:hypothetical protein
MHEEAWAAGDPWGAILREASARHDHVDVGVVREGGAPGVKDGDDADAGAQVLGSGERGLGRRLLSWSLTLSDLNSLGNLVLRQARPMAGKLEDALASARLGGRQTGTWRAGEN